MNTSTSSVAGTFYLPGAKGGVEYNIPIDRNGTPEPLKEYLTDFLGHKASAFLTRHKNEPWFLYLAFNAPHTPLQATEKQLSRVAAIADKTRRNYAGLVVGLDDAVGEVLAALHASGQDEKTLVIFMSDNGGPTGVTHSDNAPLRGAKGQVFEGGVRVPFLVSWPGRLAQGKDYNVPVSSLDVFATAVALAGAKVPESHHLDGVNILPFLEGENPGAPHEHLFWRTSHGSWAVREGDWKLLNMGNPKDQCFDLAADIGEAHDLIGEKDEEAAKLKASYAAWNSENIPPVFAGPAAARTKKQDIK